MTAIGSQHGLVIDSQECYGAPISSAEDDSLSAPDPGSRPVSRLFTSPMLDNAQVVSSDMVTVHPQARAYLAGAGLSWLAQPFVSLV